MKKLTTLLLIVSLGFVATTIGCLGTNNIEKEFVSAAHLFDGQYGGISIARGDTIDLAKDLQEIARDFDYQYQTDAHNELAFTAEWFCFLKKELNIINIKEDFKYGIHPEYFKTNFQRLYHRLSEDPDGDTSGCTQD
ncbi:MAG TPA: hypothetical protein PKV16_04875 [Caldisericia bacterium]|nr:hypothetical protein [Caldisericia bacterium]HPF48645.1 hypothetical protein [Caldisericia bacterium]HPI83695.1 hypothetical protein [Caldisericia bacterium]HPQ93100.1 hypothetical protein [Caldisericia bacterium]HRV75067.1 hypothetical protein [Caldisericia bacterium]